MNKSLSILMAIIIIFAFILNANATPVVSGIAHYDSNKDGIHEAYNLIYDDDQNITWLDYTKYNVGIEEAKSWVSSLEVDYNSQSITNWRMPTTDNSVITNRGFGYQGPDNNGFYNYSNGYNMHNSEMGYLFYCSLENNGHLNIYGDSVNSGLINKGPFQNLDDSESYWSGTEFIASNYPAWSFYFGSGKQGAGSGGWYANNYVALAVIDGDIATPVPEPTTMLLFGTGLLGLAGFGRKRIFRKH